MKPYDDANHYLYANLEGVCTYLFPEGNREGQNYLVGNIAGQAGRSFSIALEPPAKRGLYKDFAAGKGSRNLCHLWKEARGIPQDNHARFFQDLEQYAGRSFGYVPPGAPPDWPRCLADWNSIAADELAKWRGFSRAFVDWLHGVNKGVGIQRDRIVFPVLGPGGVLAGIHRLDPDGKLRFSKGTKVHPLLFGDLNGPLTEVHLHEGRWDAYALASVTGWHLKSGVLFIATLGAGNGKLVKGLIPKGAKLYCWEQHDQPGQNGKIPNEIWFCDVATAAGCEILRVQVPAKYKDLNDWVRDGVSEAELAAAVSAAQPYQNKAATQTPPPQPSPLFPSLNERPTYRLYDAPFQANGKDWEAGVYLHDAEEETDRQGNVSITIIDRWILSVARVVAITRTEIGKEHAYLLEFVPHGETSPLREVVPQSLLVGHQDELLMLLRSWGISALQENRREILSYLDGEHKKFSVHQPADFWKSVNVVGWDSPGCFVLPERTLGHQSGVCFQGAGESAQYTQNGTVEEWNTEVAAECEGNPYLVFALSCAFSGPLLLKLNISGAGFHYEGDSSSGKTTALLLATSVWGPPKFMLSWRQTANRMESHAASRSDTLLTIDESHMVDPRALDSCIYLLLGGVAKGRMKRDATAALTAHWRICVLSSGERSLETHLIAAGLDHKAGQSVRICDIPVAGKFGVFDYLPANQTAADFADRLRNNASRFFGTAGPAFVERLIKEAPALDLHQALADIVSNLPLHKLSAQQARVWRAFALVGLAGELAAEWGIVPWEQYSAAGAAITLFEAWRKAQPESANSLEHAQILEASRNAISTHGTSQFSDLDGGTRGFITSAGNIVQEPETKIVNRIGYWKDDNGKRLYLFTSEGLKRATKGHDWKRVLRALQEADAFVKTGASQISVTTRIPGENRNEHLYWIDPDKLYP